MGSYPSNMPDYKSLHTRLIHAGAISPRVAGALVTPTFQSATYEMEEGRAYDDIRYARLSTTPSHEVLARRLAAIEGTEAAMVSASGMAAISGVLLGLLQGGDHVIAQDTVYGGTASLLERHLPVWGIQHARVDAARPETWEAALTPASKLFWVEGVSNPLMGVAELEAVVAFCRAHGLISVIDNTFLSPYNLRPAELGFDLVVHSATKYLNGHGDVIAGVVAGPEALVRRVLHAQNHLGGSLDAHACFLLERGLKTLALRVARQNDSALAVATALSVHAAIARVRYPGLPDHPGHAIAARLFTGFGGMLAFETRDDRVAVRFLERVRLATNAPSLGGVETLVVSPAKSSHAGLSSEARAAAGIRDGLIRVSIGLEDPGEILEDFTAALG